MEKRWYLIDDATHSRGQIFEDQMNAKTREEAEVELKRAWDRLTPAEQKHRDAFYAGYAALDEDGCVDYDIKTDIITIK